MKIRQAFRLLNIFLLSIAFSTPASLAQATQQDISSQSTPVEKQKIAFLPDAAASVKARVALLMNAKHTIEAQYFTIEDDEVSLAAISLLKDAARRGVEVRLIVDSMYNLMTREMMAALMLDLDEKAKGHVHIKEFNQFDLRRPFCYNNRMHDKALIVDGKYLIVGDRNVANGYFDMADEATPVYQGVDVLVSGEKTLSTALEYFNERWEASYVKPVKMYDMEPSQIKDQNYCGIASLTSGVDPLVCERDREEKIKNIKAQLGRINAKLGELRKDYLVSPAKDNSDHLLKDAYESKNVEFIHDKVVSNICKGKDKAKNIGTRLYEKIRQVTKNHLRVISPYLVITPAMENLVKDLTSNNVTAEFITNSVQSNDVGAAQAGFDSTIQKISHLPGVKVKAFDRIDERLRSIETLHAKVVTMDTDVVYVGSYNWDYRSERLNSEIGVLIDIDDPHHFQAEALKKRLSDLSKKSVDLDEYGMVKDPSQLATTKDEELLRILEERKKSTEMWYFLLHLPGPLKKLSKLFLESL